MSVKCTAPVKGHTSANARAACPLCSGRSRSYTPIHYSPPRIDVVHHSLPAHDRRTSVKPVRSTRSVPALTNDYAIGGLTDIGRKRLPWLIVAWIFILLFFVILLI